MGKPNYSFGSIKLDTSDFQKKVSRLTNALADPSGVFTKTIGEMKKRSPGKIADAVRSEYNIKKAEIMPSKQKTDLKKAGKIKITGQTISELSLTYEGRLLTPLHFGMQPKTLPEKKKKYKITQKVKKKKETLSSPDAEGYIPFLAPAKKGSDRIIPFQRKEGSRDIEKVFKTVSLPEMIGPNQDGKGGNPFVREKINKDLGELLHERFNHNLKRYLGENTK